MTGVQTCALPILGRAEAFSALADRFPQLSAATGIGTLSPGVDVAFLAAKPGRAVHLENPRQTPAYKYPSQYGPKSPSFARATFLSDNRADLVQVTVPTLVVQCSRDAIAPLEVGAFVHATIKGSELVTLDATGHCPQLSAPQATAAAITAFAAAGRR